MREALIVKNREDAEDHIKQIVRKCKGAASKESTEISTQLIAGRELSKVQLLKVAQLLGEFIPRASIPSEENTPHEREAKKSLESKAILWASQAIKQDHEAMARRIKRAGRKGCGYDFNAIIINNPFDGGQREYCCPKCGLIGHYTAPLIEIEV